MNLTRTFSTFAVALVGLTVGSAGAQASSFEHIDGLAIRLQSQTRGLYSEFREHYSHAPHAQHLMNDAASMYRLAAHIHDVVHTGNVFHVKSDLDQLDRLFHHLEGLVEHIEHDAFRQPWGGHVHGDVRHVRQLMASIESTLHHLRDDVAQMTRHDHHDHGHGFGRPGISFGGPRFSVRIGR